MDINQANDNDLQKAIDDITRNNAAATAGASELEAQIQSQMGVPPVPPVPEATTAPVMPDASVVPEMAPASETAPAQGVEASAANDAAQSTDIAATVPEAPVAEPEVPIPETTATEEAPAIDPVNVAPAEVTEEQVATTVEVDPADKSGDFDNVRGAIVRDLYGLLDMVDAAPEEKFKVIREMIDETGDKSMIVKGYDAAKNIADEKTKAEALLYLFENA